MPILLFSAWLFYSVTIQACTILDKFRFHSLSGPISMTLKELGLLKGPKVQSISIFHPIPVGSFNGDVLPGGLFLSRSTVEKFRGGVVFYDEGIELSKILSSYKDINSIEVKTRGLKPIEVSSLSIKLLSPFISGCEQKITSLMNRHNELAIKLKNLIPKDTTAIFFMGEINRQYPPTVMANDGFVKWLVGEKVLKSYPSEVAYLNWSARLMNELPAKTIKIGLIDSGRNMKKEVRKVGETMNLTYPGILLPGISQIEGLIYFFDSIKDH